jgi:FkbM family methyltransferase
VNVPVPRSRYALKTLALRPRTALLRRRHADVDPIGIAMLEEHHYRRAMLDFMGATGANTDILIDAPLDASSVVVDAGAFVGEWCQKIVDRYGCRVLAFEPSPSGHAELQRRFADVASVQPFGFGLGGRDETLTLQIAGPGSTVLDRHRDHGFGTVEVELRDVAAVLAGLDVERIDLLKVNIEGGEYDLFDRLSDTGWLPRIGVISVQFHEWAPDAYRRRYRNRRAFARTHELAWDYPWVWERWTPKAR